MYFLCPYYPWTKYNDCGVQSYFFSWNSPKEKNQYKYKHPDDLLILL